MGKPSAKGLNSYNRWSSLANLAEEEDQLDRLSNLPDSVLLDIVDRLDIADAARTGILARRWKQIPTMLSKIFITVGSYDNEHKRKLTCDDIARANAIVLGACRSVLESRTTSLCTINLLCLQLFLGDGAVSIGQTVANTMVTETVGSAELTLFTMKDADRCTNDDVLTYGRQFKSFLDNCPNAFSGLARLQLENLRLGGSGLPEIFSICKRLEFLRLFNCDMGMLSLLEVSHPLLRELEIVRCYFERVDLKWLPKLTVLTFSQWTGEHDPLSLDYVPLLQTLSIANRARFRQKVLKLSDFLGKTTTISDLNLNFLCEKIWVKPEEPNQLLPMFHKLRHVTLTHISEECDLNWTLFILQGAPSLEELCIKVWDHLCEMTVDEQERIKYGFSNEKKDAHVLWRAPASDFKHRNLSVLRVFGFQWEAKIVNCIESVMKSTAALEDIYLYERPKCEYCKYTAWERKFLRRNSQPATPVNILDMGISLRVRVHLPGLHYFG